MVRAGQLIFAATSSGLHIFQADAIAAPTTLTELSSVTDPGPSMDVAVAGGLAYVVGDSGLTIVDVSSPTSPLVLGSAATMDTALSVGVRGDHAYVTDRSNRLTAIDVSAPTTPMPGATLTLASPGKVAVVGSYLYVTVSDDVAIIDISTPSSPSMAGMLGGGVRAPNSLTVSGNSMVVGETFRGLSTFDISSPGTPVRRSACGSGTNRVTAYDAPFAYGASGWTIRHCDVTDLGAPIEMGILTHEESVNALLAVGETLYSGGSHGVVAFRMCAP